jgi:hypothetical protein
MASTITGTVTNGVTIGSGTYTSPLTIVAGANVTYGSGAAVSDGSQGSLINQGTVEATGSDLPGVSLSAGGYIYNDGSIIGANSTAAGNGIGISGGPGTVVNNSGYIGSLHNYGWGVALYEGGSVANDGNGHIYGGVYINGGVGQVVNSGSSSIEDPGFIAVDLKTGGTVIDSSSIGGATAVYFGGNGSNLLDLETGYTLSGIIVGSGSATNTLELSGTLGAVSVNYNSLGLTNFQTLAFGDNYGHDETFAFTETGSTIPLTVDGFTAAYRDILDLRNLGAPVSYSLNGDLLTVVGANGTVDFNLSSIHAPNFTLVADGFGGTDVEPACFARGTLILTEEGERPVETLRIDDRVMTVSGVLKRIKWIGVRAYDLRFVARNCNVLPIRIKRGALGGDLPHRDLFVSPEHALFIDGMLVPARALVNGVSIQQETSKGTIEYYHVELAEHDIIYAEGVAAETYVDCDNRGIFQNKAEFAELYPNEEARPRRWVYCAPKVESGPELDRVRRQIAEQAGPLAVDDGVWRGGITSAAVVWPAGAEPAKIVRLAAA